MNDTTTICTILKHLIPALQSIQRDLLDAEIRGAAPQPKSEPTLREDSSAPKRFYKVAEAAAFLNVSEGLIRKLTGSKRIPYYKVGSRVMFSEEQLLTWIKSFERVLEEPSHRSARRD
jgi:excisionase family DNA binding protein